MKIIAQYDYRIPSWAMSALFNNDVSGIDDSDIDRITNFENRLNKLVEKESGSSYIIDTHDNEPYFSRTSAFNNIGDNVIDCTINIFE